MSLIAHQTPVGLINIKGACSGLMHSHSIELEVYP